MRMPSPGQANNECAGSFLGLGSGSETHVCRLALMIRQRKCGCINHVVRRRRSGITVVWPRMSADLACSLTLDDSGCAVATTRLWGPSVRGQGWRPWHTRCVGGSRHPSGTRRERQRGQPRTLPRTDRGIGAGDGGRPAGRSLCLRPCPVTRAHRHLLPTTAPR